MYSTEVQQLDLTAASDDHPETTQPGRMLKFLATPLLRNEYVGFPSLAT
jgi:hypothetical protein